jgi:RNA polymerase sigma-70 factor (ECF subfamily)
MLLARIIERTARTDGPRILAGLIRLTGDFDAAEDALQEAYARALTAWRTDGVPRSAGAWLNTVARRAAIDRLRRNRFVELPAELDAEPVDEAERHDIEDDRLRLLFVCCHPALPPDARRTLALRTLGGLTTREIARAFLETDATTAQRLVRAKRKIREARIPFEVPPRHRLAERVDTVLEVLYLVFNEGYASMDAPSLLRPHLTAEAIRLARLAVDLLPAEPEARGLLALMLLCDSRRSARLAADGRIVQLEEQDRSLWDQASIDEGVRVLDHALAMGRPGPYQTQAAIMALHATARTAAATDWPQIAALYAALLRLRPSPVVELNAAVALGHASGFDRALEWIGRLEARGELEHYHLLSVAKAEMLRRLGRPAEAANAYRRALGLVTNPAERAHLERRLEACEEGSRQGPVGGPWPG